LLAKNLRAPRQVRFPATSLTTIASKLAPTEIEPSLIKSTQNARLMPGVFVCLGFEEHPCRTCHRLRSFDLKKQNQKIAACDSSYRGIRVQAAKRRLSAPFCFASERQAISAVVSNSKVSSPSLMSMCTTPPCSASSPKRISSASGRLILSWIRRAIGRAPIAAS